MTVKIHKRKEIRVICRWFRSIKVMVATDFSVASYLLMKNLIIR